MVVGGSPAPSPNTAECGRPLHTLQGLLFSSTRLHVPLAFTFFSFCALPLVNIGSVLHWLLHCDNGFGGGHSQGCHGYFLPRAPDSCLSSSVNDEFKIAIASDYKVFFSLYIHLNLTRPTITNNWPSYHIKWQMFSRFCHLLSTSCQLVVTSWDKR